MENYTNSSESIDQNTNIIYHINTNNDIISNNIVYNNVLNDVNDANDANDANDLNHNKKELIYKSIDDFFQIYVWEYKNI